MRNALGSLNETRDHLSAGLEQKYVTKELHDELRTLADRAIGASVNLTKYLDGCKKPWRRNRASTETTNPERER